MTMLTPEGRTAAEEIARRHDVSLDAVLRLLDALERGGGSQAQFSHPDLGGMGQWSRGGMIMVGDMFNQGLKARVDQLCTDLSDLLGSRPILAAEPPRNAAGSAWWPRSCGTPSSSGSQNDMAYACFPQTRRLAIRRGAAVELYDTGAHEIGGVSQQQGGTQDLVFTSQLGTVRLHQLERLQEGDPASSPRGAPEVARQGTPGSDALATIATLHDLYTKGILSQAEFDAKKKDLLDRL